MCKPNQPVALSSNCAAWQEALLQLHAPMSLYLRLYEHFPFVPRKPSRVSWAPSSALPPGHIYVAVTNTDHTPLNTITMGFRFQHGNVVGCKHSIHSRHDIFTCKWLMRKLRGPRHIAGKRWVEVNISWFDGKVQAFPQSVLKMGTMTILLDGICFILLC